MIYQIFTNAEICWEYKNELPFLSLDNAIIALQQKAAGSGKILEYDFTEHGRIIFVTRILFFEDGLQTDEEIL